ncbi:MAG: hypothetical protein ACRCXZ_09455 [Patescibacteria group bacterium]
MKPFYRKIIPKLFTLTAIILLPMLIFLASGNTLTNGKEVTPTTTLKVNTIPSLSTIKIGGKQVNSIAADIKIIENTDTSISVEKDGFMSENWNLYTKTENSLIDLDPLYLLPNKPNIYNSQYSIFNIVDTNLVLAEKDSAIYAIQFDFGGLKEPKKIDTKKELVDTKSIKIDSKTIYFPSSQSVLLIEDNSFKILNINQILAKPKFVSKINNNLLLIINENNQLYSYNINTKELTFQFFPAYSIQSYEDNNSIFILTNLGILKFDRGSAISPDNFLSSKAMFKLPLEAINNNLYKSQQKNDFGLKIINNGTLLKYNSNLYLNQEGVKEWKLIKENIKDFINNDSRIIFLAEDHKLFVLNVYEQQLYLIGQLNKDINESTKLRYIPQWRRIFYYSENKIQSIFYDKDFLPNNPASPTILSQPLTWLENQNCFQNVLENSQFCIHENKLKQYKNVSFIPIL